MKCRIRGPRGWPRTSVTDATSAPDDGILYLNAGSCGSGIRAKKLVTGKESVSDLPSGSATIKNAIYAGFANDGRVMGIFASPRTATSGTAVGLLALP